MSGGLTGCAAALALGWAASASAAGPITATYYLGYTDTGSAITFSGAPIASDTISSIYNFSNPAPDPGNSDPAFPSANLNFAGDYTTDILVATGGVQTFSYETDDTGYLFVDGALVSSEPGNHLAYNTNVSLTLGAGVHTLELQLDNAGGPCCATAVLNLPADITYVAPISSAPEPSTWLLMLVGVGGMGVMLRRTKRVAASPVGHIAVG